MLSVGKVRGEVDMDSKVAVPGGLPVVCQGARAHFLLFRRRVCIGVDVRVCRGDGT